jgi:hypothetical protein
MAQSQIEAGSLGRELAQARFSRLYREARTSAASVGTAPKNPVREREIG